MRLPEYSREFVPAHRSADRHEQRRFIAYTLELADEVTGRVVDLLRRADLHALTIRSQRIGLEVLQQVGDRLPTIISQRASSNRHLMPHNDNN
jgi:hypothetical protein